MGATAAPADGGNGDGADIVSPWPTVEDSELAAAIAKGRAAGSLPLEEVLTMLGSIELSEDLITQVRMVFSAQDITLDEAIDELPTEPDEAHDAMVGELSLIHI